MRNWTFYNLNLLLWILSGILRTWSLWVKPTGPIQRLSGWEGKPCSPQGWNIRPACLLWRLRGKSCSEQSGATLFCQNSFHNNSTLFETDAFVVSETGSCGKLKRKVLFSIEHWVRNPEPFHLSLVLSPCLSSVGAQLASLSTSPSSSNEWVGLKSDAF